MERPGPSAVTRVRLRGADEHPGRGVRVLTEGFGPERNGAELGGRPLVRRKRVLCCAAVCERSLLALARLARA